MISIGYIMLKTCFINMYFESFTSLNYCIGSLFLVNGSHALQVSPGCFTGISDINLSLSTGTLLKVI